MTGIEKKKNFIINTVYTVILLALFYLFLKYAFGTLFPFLVAIAAAMVLQKPVNFISRKTPIKRGLASVFLCSSWFLCNDCCVCAYWYMGRY